MIHKERVESLRPLPDHAELLYASNAHGETGHLGVVATELYVIDAHGKSPTRITHDGWTHNHFSLSPDRRYIAVNRHVEDSNGDGMIDFRDRKTLYVLDLHEGREWTIEPDRDSGWGGVDWSVDGEYIYAAMMDPGPVNRDVVYMNRIDVFRVRPDGTELERLTDGVEREIWDDADGKFVSDVSLSPDGQWMAFCFKPIVGGKPFLKSHITVARPDGSEARLATDGGPLPPGMFGPWSGGDFDAEFSPDGRSIVFGRATDAGANEVEDLMPGTPKLALSSYDIMRSDIDGTNVQRLTPEGDTALKGIPDWSSDDRIVYRELNARDGYQGPVVMNADGSNRTRIHGVLGRHFRWVPPL
jgi:Tol biopolymer transport system component